MEGFVGVITPVVPFGSLNAILPSKKDILWFDSLVYVYPSTLYAFYDDEQISILSYLESEGIVEFVDDTSPFMNWHNLEKINEITKIYKDYFPIQRNKLKETKNPKEEKEATNYLLGLQSRIYSAIFSSNPVVDSIPIVSSLSYLTMNFPKTRTVEVCNLIVNEFPEPADDVTWEQIIEFKKETRFQLLQLRRWFRKIEKSDDKLYEIKDELEYLLQEYQRHLKIHELKYKSGIISFIVKTPFAFLENLVKNRLEKAIDSILSIQKLRVELLESEINLPYQEVAYIQRLETLG